jgi:hypothetical protein
MLGEPDRVVTAALHDLDPLQGALVNRLDRHAAFGPTEELEHPCLHR